MMSVKDVQEMLGIPLLGAIPEDPQVGVQPGNGARGDSWRGGRGAWQAWGTSIAPWQPCRCRA